MKEYSKLPIYPEQEYYHSNLIIIRVELSIPYESRWNKATSIKPANMKIF